MRRGWLVVLVLLASVGMTAQLRIKVRSHRAPAVAGDNPIAAARMPGGSAAVPNPMWAQAGVEGGIVHRTSQCGSTIAAYTGTAGTINTAVATCSSGGGGVVLLGAGTFNLSTTVVMQANVTLRGQGMTTILSFTGMGGSGFFFGGAVTGLIFQGAYNSSGYGSNPGQGGAPAANIRDWTGTGGAVGSYPQGGTVLNLSSAPTGLTVGTMLTLWQVDDADATLPKTGYQVSSKQDQSGSTANGICWQGSGESRTSAMQQRVRVTAITGADVTITPGVFLPEGTWRTNRTPKVSWQGNDIRMAGVEDLILRSTAGPANQWSVIQFWQAQNCWLVRTAIQPKFTSFHAGGAVHSVVHIYESKNITIRDNWMDQAIGGGQSTTTTYGIDMNHSTASLIENNIFWMVESPTMHNSGATGNVVAYNYEITGGQLEGGIQYHEVGNSLNLAEGNTALKVMADVFHGNSHFITFFRNHLFGDFEGVDVWSYGRFWNVLGNVLAANQRYKTLPTDGTLFDRWSGSCFRLGYNGQLASTNPNINGAPNIGVAFDSEVATSMFLWGNYCTSGDSARFLLSEVPSGIAVYPNPVPPNQTLPASMFRSVRPPYFTVSGIGTVAWPPHGPDVSGGVALGGRAHKLPAQLVYEAAGGALTSFNPALYGSTP